MSAKTIEAVLPLTQRDLDRAYILLKSLDLFFPTLKRIWVIVPDSERRLIGQSLKNNVRCEVISEYDVIPELSLWSRLHPYFPRVFEKIDGWHLQQVIKLAAAERVESDFFLTLDADVVCVRPTTIDDFVVDSKAVSSRYESNIHSDWYTESARVLNLPRSPWTHNVTPAVLSKSACAALAVYLSGHNKRRYILATLALPRKIRKKLSTWRLYLLFNLPWTEYALYFTFLEAKGLYDQYHLPVDRRRVGVHRSVWSEEEFAHWQPELAFGNNEGFSFVVIQSNSRIASIEVWEKIRPFLK